MDKPSMTIKPSRPVTPKKKLNGIEVTVDMNTDKLQLKLRAIAKHTEALADEFDAIDNAWQCECGSTDYEDSILEESFSGQVTSHKRECQECNKVISMIDNELPTRLEGNE